MWPCILFFTHFKAPKSKYFIKDGSIYKFHLMQNVFTDTFDLSGIEVEYAQQFKAAKWEGVNLLVILHNYGQCCGCSDNQIYIIDVKGKIEIFFKTQQTQFDDGVDEGYDSGYETSIFLPLNPKKEKITYVEHEYGPILNDEQEFKRNNAGEIITGTLMSLKKYYMWDGKGLIEIKP